MNAISFTDRYTLPILWAVIVCTLPHFINVSPWVVVACLLIWTYTWASVRNAWPLPGKTTLRILAGVFFIAAMTTHEGFTIEAFVALLALMVSLKLFELRTDTDRSATVILCYFLIVGGIFFGDTIGATLYKFFSILFTTSVLIHVNQTGRRLLAPLRLSFTLMIQALPMMLILFLFFPRIPGGLWGRTHAESARTGFSDEIAFGTLANLARNNEAAFRVDFANIIPQQNLLYWRGIILWDFDGRTWRRGLGHHTLPAKRLTGERPVSYTLTLEPHNERWLFTLDLPRKIDYTYTWMLNDYSYYSWRPATRRITYTGLSYLDTHDPSLPPQYKEASLQLPLNGNPKSRAMAEKWRREASSVDAYIQRALDFFRNQGFTYTLKPPALVPTPGNQHPDLVDRFLFETRKGFCEHYAGAFVFLMRAAGVPARIVAGYQGGERNPYGGYLVVRQSDAHAWCEVWVNGNEWQRIDPTGVVSPERLTANIARALPADETGGVTFLPRLGALGRWLGGLPAFWDFLNSRWNRSVMGYSFNEQNSLFADFGLSLKGWQNFATALFSALAGAILIIVFLSIFMRRKPAPEKDDAAEAWLIFCRKLEGIGLSRPPGQGPLDYIKLVTDRRPDLAEPAGDIVSLYIRLRYAGSARSHDPVLLRTMVKDFSPEEPNKE